jgi:hypothetical protein
MSKLNQTKSDLINHLLKPLTQPDPLIGCFEKTPDEEMAYWAKKREIEKSLKEPEIVYEIEGNKCVCRQKA